MRRSRYLPHQLLLLLLQLIYRQIAHTLLHRQVLSAAIGCRGHSLPRGISGSGVALVLLVVLVIVVVEGLNFDVFLVVRASGMLLGVGGALGGGVRGDFVVGEGMQLILAILL